MKRMTAWAIGAATGLLAALPMYAADPVVSNVRASQRAGDKLVDILYDLADADGGPLKITVAVSTNGGASFDLPATHFSGSGYGGVVPGTDKLVVWDARTDWDGNFSADVRFRITADDTYTLTNMALIPAGPFTMGDSLDADTNALPLHTVHTSAFYMDKGEVSKAVWDGVYQWATNHGYAFDNVINPYHFASGKYLSYPVTQVNWYDAVKWCNARSEKEGRVPAYYADQGQAVVYRNGEINLQAGWGKWRSGYRLPTEAEWEKAARGGSSGHRFPWADVETISFQQANYTCYYAGTHFPPINRYGYDISYPQGPNPSFDEGNVPLTGPAKCFDANGYGLYNMAGNVLEICWDWYAPYSSSAQTDPTGPASGSAAGCVIRGGSWGGDAKTCRTAERRSYVLTNRSNSVGFRTVLGGVSSGPVQSAGPTDGAGVDTRALEIGGHPTNLTVWQGVGGSFSVSGVLGAWPRSYQWRLNGVNLYSATNQSLVLATIQPADAGKYSVVISNIAGVVVSSNALLTVRGIITAQPQDQSVMAGTNAAFSVGTAALSPLSFQWQFDGSNLPKATNSTLLVNNAQSPNAGAYRVMVTTPYGQVISSQAVLTVVGRAPVILSQPQGQDVLAGENVTNSVATTGSEPQTFQWQRNGTNLTSATSATLILTNFQAADLGVYRVVVSNAFGFVISSNATLFNFISQVLDAPYLCFTNSGPADGSGNIYRWFAEEPTLHAGTNAMQSNVGVQDNTKQFLETTVFGPGAMSYWWKVSSETNYDFLRFTVNGIMKTNISGQVGWEQCTFRLPSGPQVLRWTFFLDANTQTNKWTSWLDDMSYVPDVVPAFTLQPTNISIRAGEDVVLAADVIGTPPPALQWRCNGTNLPGATNLTLALTNVQMAWTGSTFQLAASNLVGTSLSSNAVLTVTPTAPMILAGPQSLAVMPSANAAFGVNAIGAEPLRYQWQFEGANLSKATKTALTVSNALAANGGSYRVVVSNSYGATFSSNAVLTVLTFPGAVNAGGAQRWTWITGNWFMQTNVTHDGSGAAQSGITLDRQSSVMQTTVVGPGSVSFWWKVSSEPDYDFLKFATNGVEAASISGEVGWQWVTVNLGPGSQTLRWAYTKDDSTAEGADAGWVDEVRVLAPSRLQIPERLAGGGFRLLFGSGQGWPLGLADAANYEVRASTNLVNWLPLLDSLSVSNGLLFLNDTGSVNLPKRFYRVIER